MTEVGRLIKLAMLMQHYAIIGYALQMGNTFFYSGPTITIIVIQPHGKFHQGVFTDQACEGLL